MTPLQVLHGTVDAPREMQPLYGLLNAELLQVERGEGAFMVAGHGQPARAAHPWPVSSTHTHGRTLFLFFKKACMPSAQQ